MENNTDNSIDNTVNHNIEKILLKLESLEKRIDRIEEKQSGNISPKILTVPSLKNTPNTLNTEMKNKSNLESNLEHEIDSTQISGVTRNAPLQSKKQSSNFEMEVGMKWINRIGILAMLFAVGFFLKYSFDNNLVTPSTRIFIGVLIGISMLVASDFLMKKYPIPSQGLTGGGVAVLVFTVFAAFSFYQFIEQPVAFGLLVLLSATSAFLAIRYDAVSIAHLGLLTGFLTPFLLSTGVPNDIFLLSYLVILNIGIVSISIYKNWKSLNYVGFFATQIIYLIWLGQRFTIYEFGAMRMQFFTALIPLVLIFSEYLAVSIFINLSQRNYNKGTFDFVLMFINAATFFGSGLYIISSYANSLKGLFAVSVALLYMILFYFVRKKKEFTDPLLIVLLSVSLIFITIAVPIQLNSNYISLAWSIEAIALAYLFSKTKVRNLEVGYIAVSGIALISIFQDITKITHELSKMPFLNINSIVVMASIISLFLALLLFKKNNKNVVIVFSILINLIFLLYLIVDVSNISSIRINEYEKAHRIKIEQSTDKNIDYNNKYNYNNKYTDNYNNETDYNNYDPQNNYYYTHDKSYDLKTVEAMQNMRNLSQSFTLLLYSLILLSLGIFKKMKEIRIFALVLFLIVILKVFFTDLSILQGVYRILSFVALGVILIAISFVYQKFKSIITGGTEDEVIKE